MQLSRYRRDIDGLRGIAILAVVLFHANAILPGGYVGVDVFFVISGYLITSIILRHVDEGRFTFRDFWIRRIRRIVPALVVVVAASLAIAATFMLPRDFEKLAKSAVAQTIGVSNFYFWQDTGYFSGAAETKPLLHTWSLAVEEQFYLVLPFLVWALARRGRGVLIGTLSLITAASLAWSIREVHVAPSTAFFLLPSRAWELLAGSLLVFAPALPTTHPRLGVAAIYRCVLPEALAVVGMLAIVLPCFVYTSETSFPGPAALPSVIGTCLVIYANGIRRTVVSQWLSARLLVGLGLVSYSLYLWHWPLFAFARYWFCPLSPMLTATTVIVSIVLAYLSYRFVETPFRTNRRGWSRRLIFQRSLQVQLAIAAVAITIDQYDGFYGRVSGELQDMSNGNGWANVSHEAVAAGELRTLGAEDQSLPPSFLLWGDSHAKAIAQSISDIAEQAGVRGLAAVNGFDMATLVPRPHEQAVIERNQEIERVIEERDIRNIIIVQRWERAFGYRSPADKDFARYSQSDKQAMDHILPALVSRLTSQGRHVYLLEQVPRQEGEDLLRAELFRSTMLGTGDAITHKKTLEQHDAESFWRPLLAACVVDKQVTMLDVRPHCFDADGQSRVFVAGQSCYRDDDHLSNHGARVLLGPVLQPVIREIARDRPLQISARPGLLDGAESVVR